MGNIRAFAIRRPAGSKMRLPRTEDACSYVASFCLSVLQFFKIVFMRHNHLEAGTLEREQGCKLIELTI